MSKCCKGCSWCYIRPHKDFIRGGVEVDDFDDEPVRLPKAKVKKPRKRSQGCPNNESGAHTFAWFKVKGFNSNRWGFEGSYSAQDFFNFYGFYREEEKKCISCGASPNNFRGNPQSKFRFTEEYQKRNSRVFKKTVDEFHIPKRGEPVSWTTRRSWGDTSTMTETEFRFEQYDPNFWKMIDERRERNRVTREAKREADEKRMEYLNKKYNLFRQPLM